MHTVRRAGGRYVTISMNKTIRARSEPKRIPRMYEVVFALYYKDCGIKRIDFASLIFL